VSDKCFCHLNGFEVKDAKARESIGVTPQMFGAVGDGVADDTNAISNMFAYAALADKKVHFPKGEYRTTSAIHVPVVPDIEMDGMIIADHAGIALHLGDEAAYTMNKTIRVNLKKAGDLIDDGSIGLQIVAFARNNVHLQHIKNFATNVKLLSADNGIFFNTFHLDDLNDFAKYGLLLDGQESGWINDNLFIGGSITGTGENAVKLIQSSENVFLKTGMEGAGTKVNIESGSRNTFLYARCERATKSIVFGENAGKENVLISNYAEPEFENNSAFSSNGQTGLGVKNICKYPAVIIPNIDEKKCYTVGNKQCCEYFDFITSSGAEHTEIADGTFTVENGEMVKGKTNAAFYKFDTKKNKRFELDGLNSVFLSVYNDAGQITLTDENWKQYIKAEYGGVPAASTLYGGIIQFTKTLAFEVSADVTQVKIAFKETTYNTNKITGFGIRTMYPCNPIRNEVMALSALPTAGGYPGAKVTVNGALYIHNGTEWKAV